MASVSSAGKGRRAELLFLAEMFPSLEVIWLQNLLDTHPLSPLDKLIDLCIGHLSESDVTTHERFDHPSSGPSAAGSSSSSSSDPSTTTVSSMKSDDTDGDLLEMISLLPVTTEGGSDFFVGSGGDETSDHNELVHSLILQSYIGESLDWKSWSLCDSTISLLSSSDSTMMIDCDDDSISTSSAMRWQKSMKSTVTFLSELAETIDTLLLANADLTDSSLLLSDKVSKLMICSKCIGMIYKVLMNIKDNPEKEQFQRIKQGNKVFHKRIGNVAMGLDLFIQCGWVRETIADLTGDDTVSSSIEVSYKFDFPRFGRLLPMMCSLLDYSISEDGPIGKKESLLKKRLSIESKRYGTSESGTPSLTVDDLRKYAKKPRPDSAASSDGDSRGSARKKASPVRPLSADALRKQRLLRLDGASGEIGDSDASAVRAGDRRGPMLGSDMDPSVPTLTSELKSLADKRKRKMDQWQNTREGRVRRTKLIHHDGTVTLDDIIEMRKEEFDKIAEGSGTKDSLDEIGKEALRLTNEFRKSQGHTVMLKWHQSLCDIGRVHSERMAKGLVPFGHDGFAQRTNEYPFAYRSAAENVAMNAGLPASEVARVAVNGWIDSPGHRKNLLGFSDYCGIGVYRGFDGRYYLTQLFALSRFG